MVDIEMGTGTYGFLLRDQAVDRFRLVGVEGWISARIATAHDRLTVFAMLSRHGRPALATERLLETTNRLRTAVLPDRIYYPIRRKDGPSI